MKMLIAAFAVFLFATAQVVHAGSGGCHSTCADGYTYSSETGTCVPKQVSS